MNKNKINMIGAYLLLYWVTQGGPQIIKNRIKSYWIFGAWPTFCRQKLCLTHKGAICIIYS